MFDVFEARGIDEKNGFIDIDLYLMMTWEDPEIGVCVCNDDQKSADGVYQFGSKLEDVIWVPDLHVWNFQGLSENQRVCSTQ